VMACPVRFHSVSEAMKHQVPLAVLSKIGPVTGQLECIPNLDRISPEKRCRFKRSMQHPFGRSI
jgi:hypothetical protein